MNLLSAVSSLTGAAESAQASATSTSTGGSKNATTAAQPFAKLLSESVDQVQQLDETAQKTVRQLMSGSEVDVHQAVIAAEKASMAFELALSVRNKAVQAYQQVMNMQF